MTIDWTKPLRTVVPVRKPTLLNGVTITEGKIRIHGTHGSWWDVNKDGKSEDSRMPDVENVPEDGPAPPKPRLRLDSISEDSVTRAWHAAVPDRPSRREWLYVVLRAISELETE